MPIRNRHGVRAVVAGTTAASTIDMSEFTSVIVYHGAGGDIELSPDGGTTWFTYGSYTSAGADAFAPSGKTMRVTASASHIEGVREIA